MLWVDKHRPTALDKLDYHRDQASQLRELAKSGELPHMLFYGPSGAGKKTRVMALLREIFGPGVEKVKLEHRGFKTPTGRSVELTTIASLYHIEINPGDAGIYDRYVVQEISMSNESLVRFTCNAPVPLPSLVKLKKWPNIVQPQVLRV